METLKISGGFDDIEFTNVVSPEQRSHLVTVGIVVTQLLYNDLESLACFDFCSCNRCSRSSNLETWNACWVRECIYCFFFLIATKPVQCIILLRRVFVFVISRRGSLSISAFFFGSSTTLSIDLYLD